MKNSIVIKAAALSLLFAFTSVLTFAQMGEAPMEDHGMGEPGKGEPSPKEPKLKSEHPWTIDANMNEAGNVVLVDPLMEHNVGIGVDGAGATHKLTVNGMVYSLNGGFMFPDGTIQSTALQTNSDGIFETTEANITGSLKIGDNSLWITSLEEEGEYANNIYTTYEPLRIQSQADKIRGKVILGEPHKQNTIINGGKNIGNLAIGTSPGYAKRINAKLILSKDTDDKDYFNIVPMGYEDKSVFIVKSNGNVGIGTADPIEAFQVGERIVIHDGISRLFADNYHHDDITGGENVVEGFSSGICFTNSGKLCLSTSADMPSGSPINWKHNIILHPPSATLPSGKVVFSSPTEINNNLEVRDVLNAGQVTTSKLVVYNADGYSNASITEEGIISARGLDLIAGDIPDYVFEADYELLSLDEVQAFITANKHLPNIPSKHEIAANNQVVNVGEMQLQILRKVEELTLYMLQLKAENEQLQEQLDLLNAK
ncbi:MAG: hypothetical protein HRT71_11000 [Flavobacteriales bacterium]|nr:hypothetical protein [Flavobacteriales bacterium]